VTITNKDSHFLLLLIIIIIIIIRILADSHIRMGKHCDKSLAMTVDTAE
jgi:hypothetical protein